MVFSNPKVIERIQQDFIPVALKAQSVNNPPQGVEGALLAEISRSKVAAQGICSVNSAGKVLAWTIAFDNSDSILKFFEHMQERYHQFPDDKQAVPAERYRRFPSVPLATAKDSLVSLRIPQQHPIGEPCTGILKGTGDDFIARIIGRALDHQGNPIADTTLQEHYMEARLEIQPQLQFDLARAAKSAAGQRFRLPDSLSQRIVSRTYLGMLDVDPTGQVPGSKSDALQWSFFGGEIPHDDKTVTRIQIEGGSHASGRLGNNLKLASGHNWEHQVTLKWYGFIDLRDQRIIKISLLGGGDEKLLWQITHADQGAATRLPSGHPIDLDGGVLYGIRGPAQ